MLMVTIMYQMLFEFLIIFMKDLILHGLKNLFLLKESMLLNKSSKIQMPLFVLEKDYIQELTSFLF